MIAQRTWTVLGLWLLCAGMSACSSAVGEVKEFTCKASTRLINGEFDYGYEANLTVKNIGEPGELTMRVTFSSSEGEWQRRQTIQFGAGEQRTLTYFFHEPTINVENEQCRQSVGPF